MQVGRAKLPLSRSQTQDTRIGASFALPAQFKIGER
jgi:hypothetical protein